MELERLKNSLYDADVKYSQMKRIEDDSLYEGIQKGTTKELTQAKLDKKFRNTNGKLNEYLSGLDAPSRERLEIEAIKNTLERNIKETMGGKRVVDYSGMLKTLKDNPNYKSEAAKKAIEITEKMNKIHGLDHALADAFKAPKDPKLQQGLSHNVAVRYLTMAANRAVQNTVKFLPFLQMGKTAASRHAIYNAVMSSSSARELGEKLSKAAMNKDIPVSEKIDIIEMAKAQFKFSNELDKAKADGIVKEATTKQENNVIKKGEAPGQHPGANFANGSAPMAKDSQELAFSPYKDDAQRVAQTNNDIILQNSAKGGAAEQGSKLEQAEAKQEVVKGEGWTMKDGTVAKQYAEHKFEPEKWINDLSGVLSDEWIANLKSLALKHPEMFKSEADVFRVIKEIKDNPTHFFKNNRDDIALVSKILDDGSIGKVGIVKDSGKVGHVSKSSNKKELKRLQAVNEKQLGVGAPHPTLRSSVSPLAEQKAGANAHSLATETIISQKGNLVNEAETNGLSDSVSSVGDNASRAGGRQASDEQILRQGRRDTANVSQTKRPAQSDGQVEQPGAAKTDGEDDASAATKQVVEKQGSGASIGGELTANSNAHLGSGLVAGTLNSIDEDGNFSPERFAAGFLTGLAGSKAAAVGLRKMTPKLYNQILGAAEKMPQMANGNPRLLGKLYSNGKDVSLNSFAGEKAITANVGKLDQAKAMLEKGADEAEIWQKTGWFKDKDGAWKFEIGDSNARLNPGFQSGGRLDELLEHEDLFKAYPELKDVRVVKIGDETPKGAALSVKDAAQREKRGIYNVAFNNKKSTIIRKDLDAIDEIIKFEKGEADYMLHGERKSGYGALHIQKHLDMQNNGWVTKQEYLDMGQMLRKSTMEEADDKRIYTYFNDEGIRFRVVIGIGKNKERVISFYSNRKPLKAGLSYNSQNYDGNLPLNDDIIAQNGAKGYYNPAKNEIGLSDLGDKSTLMHEVQHAIQEIEDFARGGDFNTVWSVAAKNIEKKYESELAGLEKISNDAWQKYAPLQKEYIKLFDEGLKDTPEAQRLLKQMREFSDESSRADREIREIKQAVNDEQNAITKEDLQEIYRKIHGEAEARNVESRLNLDGKAHPHETFDVNPNETIVSKEDGISYSRKIEEIKREHPNVEKELDESIAAMNKESFNDVNFKTQLLNKFDSKEITTQELGKSVNLSGKQLAVLKNDIKNADFKVINESKIYFDKIGKDGDKKRFFVDIAEDGSLRVDGYSKKDIDNIPVKQSALEELANVGDKSRLKNMSFEVKAAYRNELNPIKKEAILKTAELNKLKKAAQSGDKAAAAKFEEFKAKNLDKDGNIKDGLSLC